MMKKLMLLFLFFSLIGVVWNLIINFIIIPLRPTHLIFASVLFFCILIKLYTTNITIKNDKIIKIFVIYLIIIMISTILSDHPIIGLGHVFYYAITICFIILFFELFSNNIFKYMKNIMLVILAASILTHTLVIWMFLNKYVPPNTTILFSYQIGDFLRQPIGLDDPNYFCSNIVLSMGVSFGILVWKAYYKKVTVWLASITFILSLFALISTLSRSGILAVCLLLLLFFIGLGLRRKIKFALFVFILLMCIGPFAIKPLYELYLMKIKFIGVDDSALSRVAQAIAGFRMLLEKPLLGVGCGNFAFKYIGYQSESFIYQADANWRIHNTFLEILFESGIVGFFVYFLIIILTFKRTKILRDFYLQLKASYRFSIVSIWWNIFLSELFLSLFIAMPFRTAFILPILIINSIFYYEKVNGWKSNEKNTIPHSTNTLPSC